MAKRGALDDALQPHPLLSKVLAHGPDVRVFRGYVGPANDRGTISLYPSLADLTVYLEIKAEDIVASAVAPEPLLPHGGTVVWVRPDAEVVSHGERVTTFRARRSRRDAAMALQAIEAGASETPASNLVEVRSGRLNIQLTPRINDVCASCSPCSSCGVCTTTCSSLPQQRAFVVSR